MTAGCFTATEIARAIGCSRQNVHKQLDSIPADGEKLMSGRRAKAWRIDSLPQPLIARLENVRARKGYATIEDLLQGQFTHAVSSYLKMRSVRSMDRLNPQLSKSHLSGRGRATNYTRRLRKAFA